LLPPFHDIWISETIPDEWKRGVIVRLRENFIFKSLRVESMNYCFKSPPPKLQPQIRSKIASLLKKMKQGFHRFIWRIKKLLISLNSKGMFDHSTLKCRFFKWYKHRLK
jgi:hypothetical protein